MPILTDRLNLEVENAGAIPTFSETGPVGPVVVLAGFLAMFGRGLSSDTRYDRKDRLRSISPVSTSTRWCKVSSNPGTRTPTSNYSRLPPLVSQSLG